MADLPSAPDFTFFAACPRNTEDLLRDELRGLGAADATDTRGGVGFTGEMELAYRACLWSRVASRVLLRLTGFPASSPDDLYEGIRCLPWEDHMAAQGSLAVEVTSAVRRGPLAQLNTHYAEQRIKDAVVDRFRDLSGTRPSVDRAHPDIRINLHLDPQEAIVSLDLSGEGLHRRGYRLEGGEAPLKENLAAAILLRAGWPEIAAVGGALLDPMCGSGTLLIEGALMAGDVAPGLQRGYFGFLGWKQFDADLWHGLVEEARERCERGSALLPRMYGYDASDRALGAARANARRAGLAGRIVFERRELSALVAPAGGSLAGSPTEAARAPRGPAPRAEQGPPAGLVVTNPPYGKRLGEINDLIEVYETLGERLKKSFSGWAAAVFTGNPDLTPHLDLRAHRSNVFYNGPLLCRLLVFAIDPVLFQTPPPLKAASERGRATPKRTAPSTGAANAGADAGHRASGGPGLDGGHDVDGQADGLDRPHSGSAMFANRLRKNHRHLRRWAARENVHCYRLYDADLPEYAVAVDLYEDWAHVQEYAPPHTIDPVRARRRLKEVMAATPEVLGIPPENVILKVRRPQRGADQYQRLADQGQLLTVEEGGLRFLVNLIDYLDTGLFLDQRLTRGLIRELSPGGRFLNLFAYTGAATVYAADGGARSTTTIDLSPSYLDWARRNLELNELAGPQHSFIRADCVQWLAEAAAQAPGPTTRPNTATAARHALGAASALSASAAPGPYDLIFLDAPTFSNSKRMSATLDIQRDHGELIRSAAALLSADGILLFSTNFRRFKLDPAVAAEFEVTDITRQTIPPDFARNPRIHSCFRIRRTDAAGPAV